jgi:hypothetical protein
VSAHEYIHAVDLNKAEPIDALAQLRRADGLAATHRVETLRRKCDATSFGSGEFRLQCCSPATVETNALLPRGRPLSQDRRVATVSTREPRIAVDPPRRRRA